MALHEFSIYIVPSEVRYVQKESTWSFEGKSQITNEGIVKILQSVCKTLKHKGMGVYSDQRCIDIHIRGTSQYIKVLEVKGCLSCYMQGIEKAYQIAKACEESENKVYFNVLGVDKEVSDLESFLLFVCDMYDEKISFFQNGHEGFKYVIPPSKYYRKYKWYLVKSRFKSYLKKR